jgi:hypothetical protein
VLRCFEVDSARVAGHKGRVMADSKCEHLRFAAAFEERATAMKQSRLKANLLKLAKLHRDLAAQAEQRRLVTERSRRRPWTRP